MLTAGQWKNMDPENNKLQEHWDELSSQLIFMNGFNKTFDEKTPRRSKKKKVIRYQCHRCRCTLW